MFVSDVLDLGFLLIDFILHGIAVLLYYVCMYVCVCICYIMYVYIHIQFISFNVFYIYSK